MSKYFNDSYEDEKRRFRIMDSVYEKTGGAVKPAPVNMSTVNRLSRGMNEWSGVESKAPLDDIKNILSRTTKQSSHNIATSVMAANMYKNPAQATAETLRLLDKKGFESVLFSMDTEWVGGGNSGMLATPVELGITPMMLKDGQLSLVKDAAGNEIKLGFAVQLEDSSAKRLKELIVELKNGTKNPLTLTDDEYRSLKDLINYSGNVIEDGGVLNRSAAKATLSRTNIMRNIDLIKSGLDNLDPGNKASKAIKRNELHSVISEKIMSYGFKIEEMNPIIAMHNGINADLPVWQESFQKEIHEIFGFKNKARILDTYSWMKSVYPSVLGAYYGSEGRIKSPSGLEMMSKLLGVPQIAHQASEDAYAGAKLTMQLWGFDKGRKIPMSDTIFTKGSMLFSTNGMYRGEDNPLDYILENDKRGRITKARDYQKSSTYRNRMYQVQKEFEYEFSGKKYYGVVLKNVDDNLTSVIARTSREELQSAVQQNFLDMDVITKARGGALQKEIVDYVNTSRARAEYQNMFRGADAYKNFAKYMSAYDYVIENKLFQKSPDGLYSLKSNKAVNSIDILVNNKVLSRGQAEKFQYMFNRMYSEIGALKSIREGLGSLTNNSQKSIALKFFKENLDSKFGSFTENVKLPEIAYKQGRIFDPTSGSFITVDLRNKSTLSNSLRKLAVDQRGNGAHGFAEAKERLRNVVSYMGYGGLYGDPILNTQQVEVLESLIDRMSFGGVSNRAKLYGGTGSEAYRGISDIASMISDVTIDRLVNTQSVSEIKDQESLGWRAATAGAYATSSNVLEIKNDAIIKADRYFNRQGVFSFDDKKIPEYLAKVDDALKLRVAAVSPKVAGNYDELGPEKLIDRLNNLGKTYAERGVSMNIGFVADTHRGPGLQLTMFAKEAATNLVNGGASVWVPLVDLDSNLIQVNGVKTINRFRPTYRNNGYRLETYQNKIVDIIATKDFADEISAMLLDGKADINAVSKKINSRIAWAAKGLPSAGMYGHDEYMKDTVATTDTSNILKQMQLDIKDLVYGINDTPWDAMKPDARDRALMGILYKEDTAKKLGAYGAPLAQKLRDAFSALGLNVEATSVKPESVPNGILNFAAGNPRLLGFLGMWNDPGTDNVRAAQRYHKLVTGAISGNVPDSVVTPLVMNKSYMAGTSKYYKSGYATHLNVESVFLSDKGIQSLTKYNAVKEAKAAGKKTKEEIDAYVKERLGELSQVEMVTTHDDMMTMSSKAAGWFNGVEDKKITLDPGDVPKVKIGDKVSAETATRLSKGGTSWDEYYDGIVREVRLNEDKSAYEIVVEQQVKARYGDKLMGAQAGNKFTQNIVGSDSIFYQLGVNADAVINPQIAKRPGDFIASQIGFMTNELTVSKATVKEIKESVSDVIYAMLTAHGVDEKQSVAIRDLANSVEIVEQTARRRGKKIVTGYTAVMPDYITGTLSVNAAVNKVDEILTGRGLRSNKITWKDVDTGADMVTVRGLMPLTMNNVTEHPGAIGVMGEGGRFKGVKVGFRELDAIEARNRFLFTNGELDPLIGYLKSNVYSGMNEFKEEARQITSALKDGAGKGLTNDENFGIIRTSRGLPGNYAAEMQIGELDRLITNTNSKYQPRHIANTIADPNLFGGKGFYLELPETYEIKKELTGGRAKTLKIDKILIPAINPEEAAGDLYLTDVQRKVLNVFNAVSDITENQASGADTVRALKYERANAAMPKLLDEYYTALGNALNSSDGYLKQKMFEKRVGHSGRLKARGFNSTIYKDANIEKFINEGEGLLSRKDFKAMLSGLDENAAGEAWKAAEGEGFVGIGLRNPTKDAFTLAPVKYKVMSEAEEALLNKKGIDISGSVFLTVGLQAALKADHDGDMISVFFAQFGGEKAGGLNKAAYEGMKQWQEKERTIYESLASDILSDMDYKGQVYDGTALVRGSREGAAVLDQFANVESRILKNNVGKYSNLSVKVRRMAETVGTLATDETREMANEAFNFTSILLSSAEQAPISYKKAGEVIEKLSKGEDDVVDLMAKYIKSATGLYDAFNAGDTDAVINHLKTIGFLVPEKESGKYYFYGATKGEGKLAERAFGKRFYEDDVRRNLDFIYKSFDSPNAWDPSLGIGLGEFDSGVDAIEYAGNITSGNTPYLYSHQKDFLKGIGEEDIIDEVKKSANDYFKAREEHFNALGKETTYTHAGKTAYDTMGDTIASSMKTVSDRVFGGPGARTLGVAGAALGGMWLLSSITGTPKVRQQEHGRNNQAPSSDGQYVDPNIYAGAPPGAGPSARLLPEQPGGYQRVNVNISANSMSGMTNEEVASLVSQEVQKQSGMNLNINVTSQDDRTSIDRQWLQQQFGLALKDGVAY